MDENILDTNEEQERVSRFVGPPLEGETETIAEWYRKQGKEVPPEFQEFPDEAYEGAEEISEEELRGEDAADATSEAGD